MLSNLKAGVIVGVFTTKGATPWACSTVLKSCKSSCSCRMNSLAGVNGLPAVWPDRSSQMKLQCLDPMFQQISREEELLSLQYRSRGSKETRVQEGSRDLQKRYPSVTQGASSSAKHPSKVPFTKAWGFTFGRLQRRLKRFEGGLKGT